MSGLSKLQKLLSGQAVAGRTARVFAIRAVGTALFTLYTIFLARIMTPEAYGQFMFAITILTILGAVTCLGLDQAAVKFAPVYKAREDRGSLRGLFIIGFLTTLIASLAVTFGAYLLLGFSGAAADWDLSDGMLIGVALLPLFSLALFHQSYLRGLEYILGAFWGLQILRPVGAVLIVLLLWQGDVLDTQGAALALGISLAAVVVLEFGLVYRRLRGLWPVDWTEMPAWRGVATPLLLSRLMQRIGNRADILLIGALLTAAAVAEYAVALRLAALLALMLEAVRLAISPQIAKNFATGDLNAVRQEVRTAARLVGYLMLLPALVLLIAPEFFLGLFGETYKAASDILRILVAAQIVNILAGPVGPIMMMSDMQRQHALILTVTTVLAIVLAAVLVTLHGLLGAALAFLAVTLIRNAWMVAQVFSKHRIWSVFRP